METTKRTVDELNELAKKMTGVNPKAKTDAQALNYIEQNYGGGSTGGIVYVGTTSDGKLDLTPKQLYSYLDEGKFVAIRSDSDTIKYFYYISEIEYTSGTYAIRFTGADGLEFTSEDENTPFSYTQS